MFMYGPHKIGLVLFIIYYDIYNNVHDMHINDGVLNVILIITAAEK